MGKRSSCLLGVGLSLLALASGAAISARDKFNLQIPGGLSFGEFRGYEDWRVIGVSHSGDQIAVILGNNLIVQAYRSGTPANGRPFPDGAKLAKIHWKATKSAEATFPVTISSTLDDVDFMVKDSRRFAATGGWGYAQFDHDSASSTFSPKGNGSACGHVCHKTIPAKDFVYTAYGNR